MKIGVLTGGGDVPGLNPCIKALVYRAADAGHEVLGIRRGWAGLLRFNLDAADNSQYIIPLNKANTRTIDRTGGTFIHTSRTNPGRVRWSEVPTHLQDPAHPPQEIDPPADFAKVDSIQASAIVGIAQRSIAAAISCLNIRVLQ